MQNSLSMALTQPRPVSGVAVTTAITLTRGWWGYGASSVAGLQESSTTDVSAPLRMAATIDASYVLATETVGGLDFNKYTLTNTRIIHNRGEGGQNNGQVQTRTSNDAASIAADDFVWLNTSDNNIAPGTVAALTDTYDAIVAMKTNLSLPTRPNFLISVNTIGGWNAARTAVSELPGDFLPALKNHLLRKFSLDTGCAGKVFSLQQTLFDHAADYGYQDAVNDPLDIDKGVTPRGFMWSDGSHNNAHGYNVIADYVFTPVIDAIEGGTPFGIRQIIESTSPASPANGDSVGSVVAFGSGGSAALDASNTQTDYAISSAGAFTRTSAAVPAADLTRCPVRWSKSGRNDRLQRNVFIAEKAHATESKLVEFNGGILLAGHASRWSNSATFMIAFRFQAAPGTDGTLFNVMGGSSQMLVRKLTTDALDITWRTSKAGNAVIASFTTATDSFEAADAARWIIMAIDVPNSVAKLSHFITPGSATNLANGGSAQTALAADTAQLVRLDVDFAIGHSQGGLTTAQLGTETGKFRIGDLWMGAGYRDPALQATQELFANADGTPKTSIMADGVVDGISPLLYARGRASDWRLCNFLGTQEMAAATWKNPNTGNHGQLTTIG